MDLLQSFISSQHPSEADKFSVRNYIEWQIQHDAKDFKPNADDDVDIRTYLLYLSANGADRSALKNQVAALQKFYSWAQTMEIITHNPFEDYNFLHPFLTSEQIRQRQQTLPNNQHQREMHRLHALIEIADVLNSSLDLQSALDKTLTILLEVMNLQTGWISMLTNSHLSGFPADGSIPNGFALASVSNLPPGLEHDDCRFLRQPPACHCQQMLLKGRLTRAVNIVECTRLRDSLRASGDNQSLRFHASVPLISQGKPLGLLNIASKNWRFLRHEDLHFLSLVSTRLVITLERTYFYQVAETRRKRLKKELEIAREVQESLLPHEMPDIPDFNLSCTWYPALEVGGDFYDIFSLGDGRWGLVIGDVVDKGAGAALYMAMTQSLIRSATLRHRNPVVVFKEVNKLLSNLSKPMLVPAFLGLLDPKNHTLQYSNAGHDPPIVRRASGTIESLTGTGAALGLHAGLPYSEKTITLGSGEAVVFYTDGVTEARHPHRRGKMYGIDRLTTAISAAPQKAEELLTYIEADLNDFAEGTRQQDDVTMLVLTRD